MEKACVHGWTCAENRKSGTDSLGVKRVLLGKLITDYKLFFSISHRTSSPLSAKDYKNKEIHMALCAQMPFLTSAESEGPILISCSLALSLRMANISSHLAHMDSSTALGRHKLYLLCIPTNL